MIVPVKLMVPLFAAATDENTTAEASTPQINTFLILTPFFILHRCQQIKSGAVKEHDYINF
ncbi:hypothetical protein A464_2521 [Salmonella bongori N268-08]|uniref:Uncharacterized protein n=1 Tax=Salmonella bongori N268-08 TaxID=1197719 RepID=S5MSL9_SALBN|nr:hypothetical protein A464_2521 [Salmonella bongori N268-08]